MKKQEARFSSPLADTSNTNALKRPKSRKHRTDEIADDHRPF
jgi:hypothetical protein